MTFSIAALVLIVTLLRYLPNSSLVGQIIFAQSGTTRMTTTRNYDSLNRLTSISSANTSAVMLDSHSYNYNNVNQRTSVSNLNATLVAVQ